jgi:3-hydroxyacyl-[acyl-carrier-protein] dehydratase
MTAPITATAPFTTTASVTAPGFDRVLEFEPDSHAVAVRNVPGTHAWFSTHFPRQPVLPGVLLLQDMAALAAAVCSDADDPRPWRPGSAHTLRFRHFVGPGDQVVLTLRITGRTAASREFRAVARVDGRVVATARRLVLTPWEAS